MDRNDGQWKTMVVVSTWLRHSKSTHGPSTDREREKERREGRKLNAPLHCFKEFQASLGSCKLFRAMFLLEGQQKSMKVVIVLRVFAIVGPL